MTSTATDAMIEDWNRRRFPRVLRELNVPEAIKDLQALSAGAIPLSLPFLGTCGHDVGHAADGVLMGALTNTALTKFFVQAHALPCLAILDDGGAYTDDTVDANDADASDVALLPAVPADDDAFYIAHGTKQPTSIWVNIGQSGVGTWTITYNYWDGEAWVAHTTVVDGTTGFTAAPGWHEITFDAPDDWEPNTVDSVEGYWTQAVVSGYSAVTTQPLATRIYVVVASADATWTDDTTDFNDAGAGDCQALPTFGVVNDAAYWVHTTKFCKLRHTLGTAASVSATQVWEYSKAAGAWGTLTCNDNSTKLAAGTSTYITSFVPPSDWVSVTVNGQAGYAIRLRNSAVVTWTTAPVISQGWIKTLEDGTGFILSASGNLARVQMYAPTNAGAAADSVFLLINLTQGTFTSFTWTKGVGVDSATIDLDVAADDELVLVHAIEDATAEIANPTFLVDLVAA